jgi:hypothetical protein
MSDFGFVCVRWADLFVSVALCASALRQCGRGHFPVHCNTANNFTMDLTNNYPIATCNACCQLLVWHVIIGQATRLLLCATWYNAGNLHVGTLPAPSFALL